ncbi:hypothetical protein BDZ91DRAFT_752534 [Kalaharituber pfeilii]|nr:hypothetical protein BDZ91DRAFT_752534 [Kalaharituber pfeilii]
MPLQHARNGIQDTLMMETASSCSRSPMHWVANLRSHFCYSVSLIFKPFCGLLAPHLHFWFHGEPMHHGQGLIR